MKRGRPSRGLTSVLFVRVPDEMIERLDAITQKRRENNPAISRADVARELLQKALTSGDA